MEGRTGVSAGIAVAVADAIGEDNSAEAIGGHGGAGGDAGSVLSPGDAPHAGGDGGTGGAASAESIVIDADRSVAIATGGTGGVHGRALVPDRAIDGTGGVGGAAVANARLASSLPSEHQYRWQMAEATAIGGRNGSGSYHRGGGAHAIAFAEAERADQVFAEATAEGAGAGVHAVATAINHAFPSSYATARAFADGDVLSFVDSPIRAADVTARAFARNEGPRAIRAEATAVSGMHYIEGNRAYYPSSHIERGELSAEARGESAGGATVFAVAEVRAGPTLVPGRIEQVDAVSGSTTGLLVLNQRVRTFGMDAATSLVAENEGGGDLQVQVSALTALSGRGRGFSAHPRSRVGDVILGDVIGRSTTGADVTLTVGAGLGTAEGGDRTGTHPARAVRRSDRSDAQPFSR